MDKKTCGNAYCLACGECYGEKEREALMRGLCLYCGKPIPPAVKSCPHCYEYVPSIAQVIADKEALD